MLNYKKLLGVLGISALLCTGCSSSSYEQKAIDDYLAYSEDFTKIESANMDVKMLMNMIDNDTTMKAKVTLNGDFLLKEDDIQMKLMAAMSMSGLSLGDLNIYMKDFTMYMDMLGTKQKFSMEKEMKAFLEAYKNSLSEDPKMSEELIKEQFKEFKYEDETQGIIAFVMDADKLLKKALEENPTATTEDIDIEDIHGTMTFKDGVFKDISMNMTLVTSKGQKMEFEITCAFDQINQLKAIEFPDFSEYVETDIEDGINAEAYIGLPQGDKQPSKDDYEDLGGDDL